MEDESHYSYPLHLHMDYAVQKTMTWQKGGVPSTAEVPRVIRVALGCGEAHSAHSDHQYTPEVVDVSQGGATRPHADDGHREPAQLFAGQQASVDARGQGLSRPRKSRVPFKDWQVQKMERVFQDTHYPDALTRWMLTRVLKEPESRVKGWFNYRRTKYRKNQK